MTVPAYLLRIKWTLLRLSIMVSEMAVSIGFALGIVAGATVITRITFSKQTEQKVLYIFGVIGMVIGTLCSMWFVVKLFWK